MGKLAWSKFFLLALMLTGTIFADCRHDTLNFYDFPYDEIPQNPWEIKFRVDWLFLRAREEGLSIGNLMDFGVPPANGVGQVATLPISEEGITLSLNPIQSQVIQLKPTWSNGFRVLFEIQSPCSELELTFSYTYYKTHAVNSSRATATPNPFNSTFLIGNFITSPVIENLTNDFSIMLGAVNSTQVNGHHFLRVQEYQLSLSYELDYQNCFIFKPFVGVKGVLIDQSLQYAYTLHQIGTLNIVNISQKTYQTSRFYSYGLQGGLVTHYLIGKGFYGFGELNLALVCGNQEFLNYAQSIFEALPENILTTIVNRSGPFVVRPCFGSRFGVKYDLGDFLSGGVIRLAWENHLYFKQNLFNNQFNVLNTEKSNQPLGDLSMYGLVLSGELVF